MLRWTAIFLLLALVAAAFGFTGIAESAASIAKTIFYIFLALAAVGLLLVVTVVKKK